MAFRNFMYAETDDDLSFLPKDPSTDFGIGSSFVSINTKPSVVKAVPIDQPARNTADSEHSHHREEYVIHPGSVAKRIRQLCILTISDDEEVVTNPHASIEVLLSKKPCVLQRPAPTKTHVPASSVPSQKATHSPAPMSPP
uniref:Uncharacterized protein n=1 Tax=Tanacetum cinerariifolium TaxID=118510 RepID=A0A699HN74_TANCI|nr:hypothetical protein [Tanacetum cinerariifolium]